MIIEPKECWHWGFCRNSDSLVLHLDTNLKFVCAIQHKQLISSVTPAAGSKYAFCMQDAELYYQVIEALSALSLSDPQRVQIALNFIANSKFHRPLMPQSWFFDPQVIQSYQAQVAELVELKGQFYSNTTGLLVNGTAQFLVVETNESMSTLMLIDPELQLKSGKTLQTFQQIKVMNDRLRPVIAQEPFMAQLA